MGALFLLIDLERLLDAVAKVVQPLVKVRIPVNTFLQMLSLGLRFFPILREEATNMQELQTSLGAKAPDSLVGRMKFQLTNITPLFIKALRRAEIVGQVIWLRGFKTGKIRTFYSVVPWKFRDSVVTIIGMSLIGWGIFL
jgi:energy-coupling factor transport system permease protein